MRALRVVFAAIAVLAVAPAAAHGYVYWASGTLSGETIARANLDATGVNRSFITGATTPRGLAVGGGYIYWVDNTFVAGRIARANLDGGGVNLSFIPTIGTSTTQARGMAVDGSHIYWARSTDIGRADVDGANVNQGFITGVGSVTDVAVDASHVYWSDGAGNRIGRANLDGSGVDANFITGASLPFELDVDAGHVYWTNNSSNRIGRANLDGTGVNQSFITGLTSPRGLAVDATHIYWSESVSLIGRARLDGTEVDPDYIAAVSASAGVAVDGPAVRASGVAFGTQRAGTASAALPAVVTNIGDLPLTVRSATVSGAPFGIASDACTGRTVGPGQACTVHVRFSPTAAGDAAGQLVLADDAGDSPQRLSLTGTGTVADTGPAGPLGATGPLGTTGAQGPAGADGKLVIATSGTRVTPRRVTVRYALTRAATVTLTVRTPAGRRHVVARTTAEAGRHVLRWNRRLAGHAARPGRYRLTVTATTSTARASHTVTVRLR